MSADMNHDPAEFHDPAAPEFVAVGPHDKEWQSLGVDDGTLGAQADARAHEFGMSVMEHLRDDEGQPNEVALALTGNYTGPFALHVTTAGQVTLIRNERPTDLYPILKAGVQGYIESIDVRMDSGPASGIAPTALDQRFLNLTVWVNEEFHYTVDADGNHLALNPFAGLLFATGESGYDGPIFGDVVITSSIIDDDGNTLGLDWRAAMALGYYLAQAEPVMMDADGIPRRARQFRLVPIGDTLGGVSIDRCEFVPADPFARVDE